MAASPPGVAFFDTPSFGRLPCQELDIKILKTIELYLEQPRRAGSKDATTAVRAPPLHYALTRKGARAELAARPAAPTPVQAWQPGKTDGHLGATTPRGRETPP